MSKRDHSGISQEIISGFSASVEKIVADFYASMPDEYFEKVPVESQKDHLRTIIAGKSLDHPQDHFRLKDSHSQYTFIGLENRPGQLVDFLRQIPEDKNLSSADVFTSSDNQFVVDIFNFLPSQQPPHIDHASLQGIAGSEAVEVEITQIGDDETRIQVIADNAETKTILKRITGFMASLQLDIRNVAVHSLTTYDNPIAVINVTCSHVVADPAFVQSIQRLIRLDPRVIAFADAHDIALSTAEVFIACCHIIHHQLSHVDRFYFNYETVETALLKHHEAAFSSVDALIDGSATGSDLNASHIEPGTRKTREQQILTCFDQLIDSIQSTNADKNDRLGLALAIGPRFFQQSPFKCSPLFVVYYIFGNNFQGYHVRFNNIARGGLRILKPSSLELHAQQADHLFEEAYGLAHAQHFKNKDIPEGGSKAALLVQPGHPAEKAGRAFVDALLDLNLKDYPDKSELVFLGPDENVSNELITWTVDRAAQKNHPLPACFMSSKPGAGINHKEYGITSEGVNVYLEQALLFHGIDPRQQPFTVKLTGGTNGDVAGNLVKILIRDYGDNARFLGIADGTASLEDPGGLDHQELLRLVHEDLPLICFSPDRLTEQGAVHDATTAAGEQLRNSMHNRIASDVFLTGGGRPETINGHNWRDFLLSGGVPSSKIIVEGANLFLTSSARSFLSQQGVLIVKDSSANKCGVICSSFEILAGMLMTEEEFLENKETFVTEVIDQLRKLAGLEAQVLLRTSRLNPQEDLPDISVRLSEVINHVSSVIYQQICKDPSVIASLKVVSDFYTPPMLLEKLAKIEDSDYYRKLLAAIVSAKIVYAEGIGFFENVPEREIIKLVREYLSYEPKIRQYIETIESSDLSDKEQIIDLIQQGGVSTAFRVRSVEK